MLTVTLSASRLPMRNPQGRDITPIGVPKAGRQVRLAETADAHYVRAECWQAAAHPQRNAGDPRRSRGSEMRVPIPVICENLWNLRIRRRRLAYSLIRTNSSMMPDGILSVTRSTSRKP